MRVPYLIASVRLQIGSGWLCAYMTARAGLFSSCLYPITAARCCEPWALGYKPVLESSLRVQNLLVYVVQALNQCSELLIESRLLENVVRSFKHAPQAGSLKHWLHTVAHVTGRATGCTMGRATGRATGRAVGKATGRTTGRPTGLATGRAKRCATNAFDIESK